MNEKRWFIEAQSRILGIDPDYIRALLRVESGGSGFSPAGRLIIRFEAHVFDSLTPNIDLYEKTLVYDKDEPWKYQEWRPSEDEDWRALHASQEEEWHAFQHFADVDRNASMRSIGMGAGQVMGFNYGGIGYASVQEMMESFSDSETGELNQVAAVFAYLYRVGAVTALQNANWTRVAALYNGTGQVELYAGLFKHAYEQIVAGKEMP